MAADMDLALSHFVGDGDERGRATEEALAAGPPAPFTVDEIDKQPVVVESYLVEGLTAHATARGDNLGQRSEAVVPFRRAVDHRAVGITAAKAHDGRTESCQAYRPLADALKLAHDDIGIIVVETAVLVEEDDMGDFFIRQQPLYTDVLGMGDAHVAAQCDIVHVCDAGFSE